MSLTIEIAKDPSPELLDALNRLIPQLSASAAPLTEDTLAALLAHEATHVLIARDDARIVGTLTLVAFPIPTAGRAWIEDVVVDESARGQGVGEALTKHALTVAKTLGAATVDLTSRPSREAANRLYQRLGFQARESNVYRFTLGTG